MNFAVPESQRDSVNQPRVAEFARLPWVTCHYSSQPQRGCITSAPERCNPVGVENILDGRPRVVVARRSGSDLQPWAELRYPVGVNPGVSGGIRRGQFWGHLNYIDHDTGMHVTSTAVTGFMTDPNDSDCRDITYNVSIDGVPGTAYVVACDKGEPGINDSFAITLSNGYSARGDLGGAQPGGGNIQLHKCPPGWAK